MQDFQSYDIRPQERNIRSRTAWPLENSRNKQVSTVQQKTSVAATDILQCLSLFPNGAVPSEQYSMLDGDSTREAVCWQSSTVLVEFHPTLRVPGCATGAPSAFLDVEDTLEPESMSHKRVRSILKSAYFADDSQ